LAELQDNSKNEKLVTVTRQDLASGYQTVQSAHVVAEFADVYPRIFRRWKLFSNSLICLAVKDLAELNKLCETLDKKGVKYVKFFEPDVEQLTAIAIEPSEMTRKITSFIPLANKKHGDIDKHQLTKEKVLHDMRTTFQFQSQSVLAHGESVYKYYQKLVRCLDNNCTDIDMRIPDVIREYWPFIKENLYDEETLKEYMILHDCGKPYCRTVDEEGKQHFPDHAQKSYEIYMQLWGNPTVGELIRSDMDIHLLKDDGIDQFMEKPLQQICTHLIVGLAELLSNAQMFGGVDSTGFKIKYKSLEKRAKKILPRLVAAEQEAVA
jgi:hypothetical protein